MEDQTTPSKGTLVFKLFTVIHTLDINVHVPINRFVNPIDVQNDLLIAFSLCHSSVDYKQGECVVRI